MFKLSVALASGALFVTFSVAHAAPIGAFSELQMSNSFVINNGNVPVGLQFSLPVSSLEREQDADSMVADPTVVPSQTSFVQVGNSTQPYIDQRTNASQLPGGFEGAASGFDIEISATGDPLGGVFFIGRRDVEHEGSASIILLDDTIEASASSFFRLNRRYTLTNTTDQQISFNIAGQFDAMLRAEYIGDNGLAHVAGGFGLDFSSADGFGATHFPVAPYLTTVQDADPGSIANQFFQAFSDGATGLNFDASASATGSGSTTLATVEAEHRYIVGLTLDPFAEVTMSTSFTQANSVEHLPRVQVAPVPLPASAWLLLCIPLSRRWI